MPKFVRIRLENDTEVSVSADYAAAVGADPIAEDADLRFGRVQPVTRSSGRPMKPKSSVAELAAAKKANDPAAEPDDASTMKE